MKVEPMSESELGTHHLVMISPRDRLTVYSFASDTERRSSETSSSARDSGREG
jgi:hypothetical protein